MLGLVTGPANALLFVYTWSVLGSPRLATAAMLVAAGMLDLGGWSSEGGLPTTWAGG
jgi:hypothetical protein